MQDDTPRAKPSATNNGFRPLGMVVVVATTVGLAAMLATHPMPDADAALPQTDASTASTTESGSTASAETAGGTDGNTGGNPGTSKADPNAKQDPNAAKPPDAAQPIAELRPLRVTGLGWELLAPGLLANDGLAASDQSEFRKVGLDVQFSVSLTLDELEAKLARGGGGEQGADVAVMPLPAFVASYEQLRALSPEVFFVLGWSRGRDAIAGTPGLLTGGASKHKGKLELVGAPGQSATMLALFALDEIGIDTRNVELLAPNAEGAKRAPLRAVERSLVGALDGFAAGPTGRIDARDLLLTSADVPRLIPMVAVAPSGFVHANTEELARFARTWLGAIPQLEADVPAAARRIAKQRGAPEAVVLLEMLGYVSFADLADAARLAGLSGRDAVSLEVLFQRNYQLWRDVGVLSTPAPEHAPLDNTVIARVALGEGAPVVLGRESNRRDGQRLALVHAIPNGATIDEQALVAELGFLAGAFSRAEIELYVRGDKSANRRIVAEAIERYDLDPAHVRVSETKSRDAATVRVLVP